PFRVTVLIMGGLVVLYTTMGGIKAVTWADVQQMMVILFSLILSFGIAISLLPKDVSFLDRKSTRLNSSHVKNSYAVSCMKHKNRHLHRQEDQVEPNLSHDHKPQLQRVAAGHRLAAETRASPGRDAVQLEQLRRRHHCRLG